MQNTKTSAERNYRRSSNGFSIGFDFVPMPTCIWNEVVDLSLGEFRLLGYLNKQLRFGEEMPPLSDDELINGRLALDCNDVLRRIDCGCGLSRNGIKLARKALSDRGWLEMTNVSKDTSRPQYLYRVLLSREASHYGAMCHAVPRGAEWQEVAQNDSVVSQRAKAVSQCDDAVARPDTCNKEEEKSSRKTSKEKGEVNPPLSPNVLLIAQQNFMKRLEDDPATHLGKFAVQGQDNPRRALFIHIRMAAKSVGLSYEQARKFLADHPTWCDWEDLKLLDSQQEIEFPARVIESNREEFMHEVCLNLPEDKRRAASDAVRLLREAKASNDGKTYNDAKRDIGRAIGTMNSNVIDEFIAMESA